MNKPDNISTKIISAIEREEIDDIVKHYIFEADEFLLNTDNPNKPDFLDDFFDKAKNMLVSTVNGCIKSRNNPKKKDDLKKYKEGYFNEIIQNANDVVLNSQIKYPTIEIQCKKYNEYEYEIVCLYPDKGFALTDIYGFCSRGNSNKSSELGQEGMYGIGIKSLFCFATYFCIENNVKIELSSKERLLDTINISHLNILPNKTKLTLKFQYDEKIKNKHAGFNVKKIAGFIDSLIEGKECDSFFYSEEEGEVIFDPRSLIFTELRNNRNVENSIKKVKFKCNEKIVELNVSDSYYENNSNIKISRVKDDMEYLVFHYPDLSNDENSLSLAYAINKDWTNLRDRIYATYFVGNYSSLLEKMTGCLVNTKAINSSRSGLERENENDPAILQKIKAKGKETISDLISILNNDKAENCWREISSDVLCHLLDVYRNFQIETNEEILPDGIFMDKVESLSELFENKKLYLIANKNFILKIKDSDNVSIEENIINKNRPANSDDGNCRALYEIFDKKFIDKDIIIFNNDNQDFTSLCFGIRKLVKHIFNENDCSWLKGINIPFINGAKNLIYKRIKGDNFNQIMKFIDACGEIEGRLVKQLVARFELNNSFDYMGNYSKNNVVNWIFSDDNSDNEFKMSCKEYEKSYTELKELIKTRIHSTRYYYSTNWNASSDYWYERFTSDAFDSVKIYENQIRQFLNLLSKGVFKFGYHDPYFYTEDSNLNLFVHSHNCNNIILRNRDRSTTYWDGEFKYFHIGFLNRTILNFNSFKSFRQSIDEYNKQIIDRFKNDNQKAKKFKINYLTRCKINNANLALLENIFKWLSTYEEKVDVDVETLTDIKSQDTDLIKFTKLFLGDINIRLEKIDVGKNGSKFIGYITNVNSNYYTIRCRKSIKSEFEDINSKISVMDEEETKKLVVFYSNSNEQAALSDVLLDMSIGNEIPVYIEHFINTDNIKQLSSSDYDKYLERAVRDYRYAFESENVRSFLEDTTKMEMEDIFTILSGEMSYQNHCPICNDIPTLNIKGDDKVSASKNCLAIIIPVLYKGEKIYVKTICCKSCFEEYKVSLTSAEMFRENGQNILELKSTICDSSRSYDFVKRVNISPDNWKIIFDFNKLS
ncbi:hypothetical protein ACER0A_004900 [Haloimpatiens sp. FM7315]|uniref:hypothetical protein n=1 Tax=Haloimpatiens sp. FM7315 TaxID=3298609 RepID=UPI00370A40ED